jgi:iron complex outermembrane recepter protein
MAGQVGETIMKQTFAARLLTLSCLTGAMLVANPALAQTAPEQTPTPATPAAEEPDDAIVVTGSRIKRKALDSAVPIEVITTEDLRRNVVSNPEQFIATLNTNGNSADNLASQSDVAVEADQRNVNGFSGANLRGQGSASTLVLINGRRVATQGLSGSAVDVNQVPLAAVSRIEVLKDGASAIYGTDAIGGVINFILKEDFQGFNATAFTDVTQEGGGNIYQAQATAGYGDLDTQNFNIMGSISFRRAEVLEAVDRDWINTHQPDRGLAIDTRGTPFATIFPLAGTLFPSAGTAPFLPGSTTVRASGGINVLALPGGQGCASVDGQTPYDAALWANPTAALACAYDTGRAGILQQPQDNLTYLARGVMEFGEHNVAVEYTGANANAERRFSEIQLIGGTGTAALSFPSTTANAAAYDAVFDRLLAAGLVTAGQRGLAMNYRWRCGECGQRVIETETDSGRFLLSADGPLGFLEGWDYSAGASYGFSESTSVTAGGYYYRATDTANGILGIRDALRTGTINPFLFPGQTQSQAALDLLRATEARGINIASGKSEVKQADFSISGPVFDLPAGAIQAAFGVDVREEIYDFQGEKRTVAAFIEGAPIDSKPALRDVSRDVNAVYAEVLIPVLSNLDLNLAVRRDDYSGFGDTTNPKITVRYTPIENLTFRGSYNTGFRVPTFTDLFDPVSAAQQFAPFADPAICPNALPTTAIAGCVDLANPATDPTGQGRALFTIVGGKADLEPEEAEQFSVGFVVEPIPNYSLSVDWWRIERTNLIQNTSQAELVRNYAIFADRFIRDPDGRIRGIDQRRVNAGGSLTEGVEISGRGEHDFDFGQVSFGADISLLTERNDKVLPTLPYGPSLLGKWTPARDLSLQWRHTAFVTWTNDPFTVSLSQIFRSGYLDQVLPGVANGSVNPPNDQVKTDDYITYNLTGSYRGFEKVTINLGIKNLFNEEPPFARSYLSATGGGSNWESRVADPRGRSFTVELGYTF